MAVVLCLPVAGDQLSANSLTDRQVLELLYDETNGPDWIKRSNWLSDMPLSDWSGVVTNENGQIRALNLQDNNLSGPIPSELASLTSLEQLDLRGNQLTGTIPPELASIVGLQKLVLAFNRLSGSIPSGLASLVNLRELDLGVNQLSGSVPPELASLTSLQSLKLGLNQLTGSVPAGLASLTNLRELDLRFNMLSGSVPLELASLTSLRSLNLALNRLTGTIPPEFAGLTSLEVLILRGNSLCGSIPSQLASMTNLLELDLGGNKLTGTIPPELSGLTSLRTLLLGGNQLRGTIPPQLASLTRLQQLDLGFNQDLAGPVPSWLRELPLRTAQLIATQVCLPENAGLQELFASDSFVSSGLVCGQFARSVSSIDVAVIYTPAARERVGGTAAMEAKIDLLIAESNQAYLDSGINQRLVLVAREEVEYTESGNASLDLNRLESASDGYMDEVHELRDQVGADLVDLIADLHGGVAGVANLPGPFSIICANCDAGAFTHELGHSMGLSHDRYVDPGPLSPYSAGYVNQRAFDEGAPEYARWRTTMSYGDQCAKVGMDCKKIVRFSNANLTYLGDPLGVPGNDRSADPSGPADAARTLNSTRHAVASFRTRPATGQSLSKATQSTSGLVPRAAPRVVTRPQRAGTGGGGGLFAALSPSMRGLVSSGPETLRRREVRVDTGTLSGLPASGAAALPLHLFDDLNVTGMIERHTPTYSGGYALSGRLSGIAGGSVVLVVNGDVVAGTVQMPGATYRIQPLGQRRHSIVQVDPSQLPEQCETARQPR